MYLSKLEVHGFKSFAERTTLQFAPGVTAIVGPNGCGKSNIVDAVRWVIGEQRARVLRSDKMDNVIFNGTSKKRPLGMAEVMLTVENTRGVLPVEYTEVTLGRRLFRSGESEYLLNGVKCRLQDILDLFMDTGMGAGAYSVIELKMIEEILSENAQDRRRLFEEAAGITKYKIRRKQALGKLEETRGDLSRLNDLTEEIGKQVRTLKRQAEKAAKYREYETRLHELELALAQAECNRLDEQQRALRAEIEALQNRSEQTAGRLSEQETQQEQLRAELNAREQTLTERRRRLGAHREQVRSLESDLRIERERLDAYRRDLERIERERAEADARQTALEETAARLTADLAAAEPQLAAADEALSAARTVRDQARVAAESQQRQAQELRRRLENAEQEFNAARRNLDRLTNRLDLLEQDRARHERQTSEAAESLEQLEARVNLAARTVEESRAQRDAAHATLDQAAARRKEIVAELEAAQEALQQVQRRREAVAAELNLLESLVSSYEEFSDAVQFLATAPGWSASDLRTVSDVLTSHEDAQLALEAALGEFASCIVVASDAEARQALALLRNEERGQAGFIILDRIPASPTRSTPSPTPSGTVPLIDLVRLSDPTYERLASILLENVYLADDLDAATEAAQAAEYGARLVTRSGEWIDTRGLLKGGSRKTGPSPLTSRMTRREQRDATRVLLTELDAELAERTQAVQRLQEERDAVPFEASRQAAAQADKALSDAERAHERAVYERDALLRRQSEVAGRTESIEAEMAQVRTESSEQTEQVRRQEEALNELRRQRRAAEETFQQADAESRGAVARYNEANIAAVQARNRRDNIKADLDRTMQALKDLADRAGTREQDLAALMERIRATQGRANEIQEQLDGIRGQSADLERAVTSADEAVTQVRQAISDLEGRLRQVRQERETLIRDEHGREVRLTEIHTRLEDLLAHVQENFGRDLRTEPVTLPPDLDEQTVRAEVLDLRNKIKALGTINALALETYDEEAQRYEFLIAQQADLRQAEQTLVSTIEEINTTAAERFQTTYDLIRGHFIRIFAHLFGDDAQADLELANPDDLLESPIEIMAKPRGKRPSTIAQLSGGEKTLTAIALLFAIYLVKPSPFCILDEVDAPLDDANVTRFMDLIRQFSESTQFILVTHNKRTMELADRMYGITMQEQGVSKLVAVDFTSTAETDAA